MKTKEYMTRLRNFKHLLDTCASDFADVHFMEYRANGGVEAKTYRQLQADSDAVSRFLASKGFQTAHAALIGGAGYRWVTAFFGIVDTGCAAVPLAPAETDEMNVKLVDFADCEILFFDSKHKSLYEKLRAAVPSITCFVSVDDTSDSPDVFNISEIYAAFAGHYENDPASDSLCALMYTSGTTGFPKGVMLSHRNLIATGTFVHEAYPTPRMLGVLPYHHAFGLTGNVTKIMVNGRTLCLCDNLQNVAADLQLYKVNGMLAVPQMIKFMMNGAFRYAREHAQQQFHHLGRSSFNAEAVHQYRRYNEPKQQVCYIPAAFYSDLLISEQKVSREHIQEHDYCLPEYDKCHFISPFFSGPSPLVTDREAENQQR